MQNLWQKLRDVVGSPRSYLRRRSVQGGLILVGAMSLLLAMFPGAAQGQRIVPVAECTTGTATLIGLGGVNPNWVNLSVVNAGDSFIFANLRIVRSNGNTIREETFAIDPGASEGVSHPVANVTDVRGVVRILSGAKDFSSIFPTLTRRSQGDDFIHNPVGQAIVVLEHCQQV
jgi:hypothetical protein